MKADSPLVLAAGLALAIRCALFDMNRSRPMII